MRRPNDRDRSGATGGGVLAGIVAVLVAFVCGAGVAADFAIGLGSAVFGRGPTLLPLADIPRLLGAIIARPGSLASAYPEDQRHPLPGNTAMWWLLACGELVYAAIVLAVLIYLVPLVLAPAGFERPATAVRLLGVAAVRRATKRLHPKLASRSHVGGPRLGRIKSAGLPIYASIEDSILLVGPPGAGKGTGLVYRAVADAPGSVVATSTKADVLLNTAALRQSEGRRVWVFDPQEISGWPDVLRWSPTRGCEDPSTAMIRATGMTEAAQTGKGVTNGDFWAGQTAAVIRCYLHAAALADKTAIDVLCWSRNPKSEEPISILLEHPNAADGWGDELSEQRAAAPNHIGSVWAGVRRAFDSLADPRVARACSPRPGTGFDPEQFIRNGDTIYLLGSNKATLSVAPLIVALIEDIVEAGRDVAATALGERMPLPMTLALDEVANIAPLPSLPYVLGDGRGHGFQTIVVFQSLAQARSRWGAEEAEVIWDTCTCRMILPGLASQRDGKMISDLLGEYDELTQRRSRWRGTSNYQEDIRTRPAVPVHAVRELKPGTFLLIYRHLKPIIGQLELSYCGREAARFDSAVAAARRLTGRMASTTEVA